MLKFNGKINGNGNGKSQWQWQYQKSMAMAKFNFNDFHSSDYFQQHSYCYF